jgi:PBP1b-binding outer membrane lipoprotein LpoB
MKARIIIALAVLTFAAGCSSYRTCATYAKVTPAVKGVSTVQKPA